MSGQPGKALMTDKSIIPFKSRLVNQCDYWGYFWKHGCLRVSGWPHCHPTPAWVTTNRSCALELPAKLEGHSTKESPPFPPPPLPFPHPLASAYCSHQPDLAHLWSSGFSQFLLLPRSYESQPVLREEMFQSPGNDSISPLTISTTSPQCHQINDESIHWWE